jgi:hypothetical protein
VYLPAQKNFLGMSTNGHYLRVAREIRTDDLKQIVQTTMWLRLARRLQQPLEVRKPKEEKWSIAAANATIATRRSRRGKDGCARRFTILRMMATIQVTAATTLNPSPRRLKAAGKNTEWNGK